jgi:predicted chitinase
MVITLDIWWYKLSPTKKSPRRVNNNNNNNNNNNWQLRTRQLVQITLRKNFETRN